MESLLQKVARHAKIRANLLLGENALSTPRRWLVKPALRSGENVCLFVSYAKDGGLSGRAVQHINGWTEAGYRVILIAALDNLDGGLRLAPLPETVGVMLRQNEGYDFGAWASAIGDIPQISELNSLALSNDSVLGPIGNFPALIAEALEAEADLVGLTESNERRRHLQSFFIIFKARAVRSSAFQRFWSSIKNGDRDFVVSRYETLMSAYFRTHGMNTCAIFPTPGCMGNPVLERWKELLERGFPYVKAALFQDPDFRAADALRYFAGNPS